MAILKFALVVFLIIFVISSIFGLIGFLIDIIRYPQKHEKVNIISSSEAAAYAADEEDETEEGLILDESISIFGGEIE